MTMPQFRVEVGFGPDGMRAYLSTSDRMYVITPAELRVLAAEAIAAADAVDRAHMPVLPPWRAGETGERAVCAQCDAAIIFDGQAWDHLGIARPRHIAWPKE
jgi:hypothetical protein